MRGRRMESVRLPNGLAEPTPFSSCGTIPANGRRGSRASRYPPASPHAHPLRENSRGSCEYPHSWLRVDPQSPAPDGTANSTTGFLKARAPAVRNDLVHRTRVEFNSLSLIVKSASHEPPTRGIARSTLSLPTCPLLARDRASLLRANPVRIRPTFSWSSGVPPSVAWWPAILEISDFASFRRWTSAVKITYASSGAADTSPSGPEMSYQHPVAFCPLRERE